MFFNLYRPFRSTLSMPVVIFQHHDYDIKAVYNNGGKKARKILSPAPTPRTVAKAGANRAGRGAYSFETSSSATSFTDGSPFSSMYFMAPSAAAASLK